MRGRIKRFIEDKGYGFITGEDGQDYFFHISQVRDMVEIKNWMVVNFDIVDGKKGKNAVNIRVSEQNNTSRFVTLGDLNIRLNNIKEYSIGTYFIVYKKIFTKTIIKKERKGFLGIKRIESIPIYKPTSEWHRSSYDSSLDKKEFTDEMYNACNGKSIADMDKDYNVDTYRYRIETICYRDKNGDISMDSNVNWKNVKIDKFSPIIGYLYKFEEKNYLEITTFQRDSYSFGETEVNFDVVEKYNEINNAMQYGH